MNSMSFFQLKFSSSSRLPAIMISSMQPQNPIRLPRIDSQPMAKRIPPEPFHPQMTDMTMPTTPMTHILFSLASQRGSGRNGINWCFRMIRVQFIRNANRVVTKENWIIGSLAMLHARICAHTSSGHNIMSVSPENDTLGAFPNYLYSNQFQVTGAGVGAGVIYIQLSFMPTSGIQMSFFYWVI